VTALTKHICSHLTLHKPYAVRQAIAYAGICILTPSTVKPKAPRLTVT